MKVLISGGAGFIGSNLADAVLANGDEVVVVDDLSTGVTEAIPQGAELVKATIEDLPLLRDLCDGVNVVFHMAAARAVLRSVEDPLGTDQVNTRGTLNVLLAARDVGVGRVVLASSSSVYGGAAPVPTPEDAPLLPMSPYAVTKLAGEHYARVFARLYGLETVSLRFFNVFGPRQRPDSAYAAVIPLFIHALANRQRPEVHGDGLQSRDFTYIDNVVTACLQAAMADPEQVSGKTYNIAGGRTFTLLELLDQLGTILDVKPDPHFVDRRPGDIRISQADIARARADLGYDVSVSFDEGLRRTVEWLLGTAVRRSRPAS